MKESKPILRWSKRATDKLLSEYERIKEESPQNAD